MAEPDRAAWGVGSTSRGAARTSPGRATGTGPVRTDPDPAEICGAGWDARSKCPIWRNYRSSAGLDSARYSNSRAWRIWHARGLKQASRNGMSDIQLAIKNGIKRTCLESRSREH